jgi:thiol-disulfide isomerase/thioredoxin
LIWLSISSLIHCSENLPVTNKVQAIELNALDGMISDSGFRGLVVAMASWCPPCREELPILSKLYGKYREKGIQIIAISLDANGPEEVQPLINKLRVQFPVYWVGTRAAQRYRISGVPTTLVYNKGRLIERLPGSRPERAIENKIKSLVGTDPQA